MGSQASSYLLLSFACPYLPRTSQPIIEFIDSIILPRNQ